MSINKKQTGEKHIDSDRVYVGKKSKPKREYLDRVIQKCKYGIEPTFVKTKATIDVYNREFEELIDEILPKYLKTGIRTKEGVNIPYQTKLLFLLDPCGRLDWRIVEKIGIDAGHKEGIEVLINFSWDGLNRTIAAGLKKESINLVYGTPTEEIDKQFPDPPEMGYYLEKYEEQLRKYFTFVGEADVSRDHKIKSKRSKYRTYFLIYGTNNQSAANLLGYETREVKKAALVGPHIPLTEFMPQKSKKG